MPTLIALYRFVASFSVLALVYRQGARSQRATQDKGACTCAMREISLQMESTGQETSARTKNEAVNL